MKRVFFHQKSDYKQSNNHKSNPDFVPLVIINDLKAQKNGTKKTVFWVKKRNKDEDGNLKGEKWDTSQQYVGDWKNNKKDGYGIKIYNNKDKYEGYWQNDMRHGKGTYWLCIGKNKYRKLYTGDWVNNKKEGSGIYFYKDGSCYDGYINFIFRLWKNSKRDGKGLMIYSNGDIYEGYWLSDLKNGYGILEKKNQDKYYGYWNKGLKEGQGYYYYSSTGKIYLGEWHEDVPRCGIFTDVDDENNNKVYKKHFLEMDPPSLIPILDLNNPNHILEESISNIHFLRNIKIAKNKTINELFSSEFISELTNVFNISNQIEFEEGKLPENKINISEFLKICSDALNVNVNNEVLELILYVFELDIEKITIDFMLFCRLFYLIYARYYLQPEDENYATELSKIDGDNKNLVFTNNDEYDDKLHEEIEIEMEI